jgi:small-conductance mechanosensitive channel
VDFDQILSIVAVSLGIIAVIVVGFEIFIRIICSVVRRSGGSQSSTRTITEVIRILYVLIAAIAVASYTGLASTLTVLTLSGIAGLLVSLALQPTLTNMISGYYLMREGAIHVGDRITYGAINGTIIRVALRNTWVLTEAGDVAIIGNSTLYNGPLINRTRSASFAERFRN